VSDPNAHSQFARAYAIWTGRLAALLGASVFCGWALGQSALTNFAPGNPAWPPMAPATGLVMLLLGCALSFGIKTTQGRYAGAPVNPAFLRTALLCLAAAGTLISLLRLAAMLRPSDRGPDQVLFGLLGRAAIAHGMRLVPMTPATAVGLALLGVAVLLGIGARGDGAQRSCALLAFTIGWLGFTHFIYGGEPLLPFSRMALHTALLLMALSAGALALRPGGGLAALCVGPGVGGHSLRRLLPAALIVPLLAGMVAQYAEHRGWVGIEAGLSLLTLSTAALFTALLWVNAARLESADAARRQAEQRLRTQLERLDLLGRITRSISERRDPRSIFQVALGSLEEHLPIDCGAVGLHDSSSGIIEMVASVGATPALRFSLGQNELQRCMRGELIYEHDLADARLPLTERLRDAGFRALVIAPLSTDGSVFGVLLAARRAPTSFSSADCEFLRQLSEHLALTTHQARLYSTLQQAYEELRQSQQAVLQQERLRALGQMASGIAHDINNALSPAALYAESLLERNTSLNAQARDSLIVIQRAIEGAAHTVARMREFYRPRDRELTLVPVDLNALLSQVVDLTRARWHDMELERGALIELRLNLAQSLPPVLGAEAEIRDALTNLVLNAVDAMPTGGTLTLSSSARAAPGADEVIVEVRDGGVGMSEEVRSRCLEPFFTTKGERGTGLGLAMVYGMTQRHGASLEIDSVSGEGTCMRLRFTAVAPRAPSPQRRATALLRSLRLLVVDDDPLLRVSLRDALESEGHEVHVAEGGQAGIDAFTASRRPGARHFDITITDLGMPRIDGRAVAAAVKATAPQTPVILLTGWGQRLQAEKMPEHIDRVLSKPPKLSELRAALAELVPQSVEPVEA
jgi:signal transduction histidine kinase/ActR/RegA family two-component response regulator